MDIKRISMILAALELITAVSIYQIYTLPFRIYGGDNYWSLPILGTNILSLLFLLIPILAFILILKNKAVGFLFLGLFPVVAYIFGVIPIPFANYLYTSNPELNTIFITIIDIMAIILALWLYLSIKKRSNKVSNRIGAQSAPPG